MQLKQITLVGGLALVMGQALALGPATTPNSIIHVVGASAQQEYFEKVVLHLCTYYEAQQILFNPYRYIGPPYYPTTPDVYYDTATGGNNHRAIFCNAGFYGHSENVLFEYSTQGGSFSGVSSVARGESRARMVVDSACVATGKIYPDTPQYLCPHTVNVIPDAGLSDVEPALFQGINLPAGASALTTSQVGNLASLSQAAVVFGIATTNNVNTVQPNLSRAQVTTLAIGSYGDWGNVNAALAGKPVVVCRRVPGSGAQAAMNAYFSGFPCTSAYVNPANHNSNSVTNGSAYTVIENSSQGAVADCLNAAYNGGAFTDAYGTVFNLPAGSAALGVLSVEKQPGVSDKWKFSNLDGTAATVLNATTGAYDFYVENSFQYRNRDICAGGANAGHAPPCLGGETLVVAPVFPKREYIDAIIQRLGDPVGMVGYAEYVFTPQYYYYFWKPAPGVAALPSNYAPTAYSAVPVAVPVMKGERNYNTCAPSTLWY